MTAFKLEARLPAKINLFLHVVGRRPDGYHLLESLFCPVSLCDNLRLTLEQTHENQGLEITRQGPLAQLPEEIDLTVRACKAFFSHPGIDKNWAITIHVDKHIPEQAGLGGGSSNAAGVLNLLQGHFNHPWKPTELADLALALGADVPFFLAGDTAFVEGIGEKLTPFPGVKGHLVVYKPPQNCPTGKIFGSKELTRDSSTVRIAVFDSGRFENHSETVGSSFWRLVREQTQNSLQKVVEATQPDWLRQFQEFSKISNLHSSLLVRMTGSGSAMFAVFDSAEVASSVAKSCAHLGGLVFECEILDASVQTVRNF